MKKTVPEFASDEQAERFVETADLTHYDLSGFKPAQFEFQVKAAQLNMRLPQTLLDAVRATAKARGVPYTRFVRETLERVVSDRSQDRDLAPQVHVVGNIRFATEQDVILVGGQPVQLPARQRAILELLLRRKDIVITKEVFLTHLYGEVDQPEVRIIDVLLAKLRRRLAEAGADHVIRTVWGRGYTLQEKAAGQATSTDAEPTRDVDHRKKLREAS